MEENRVVVCGVGVVEYGVSFRWEFCIRRVNGFCAQDLVLVCGGFSAIVVTVEVNFLLFYIRERYTLTRSRGR